MIRLTLDTLDIRSGKKPTDAYTVHMTNGTLLAECGTFAEAVQLVAFFRTLCGLTKGNA